MINTASVYDITEFVRTLEPRAALERAEYTLDNVVAFFTGGTHGGLVAKSPKDGNAAARSAIEREAAALRSFPMSERYRAPELVAYSDSGPVIVERRIYGDTALQKAVTGHDVLPLTVDMINWLEHYNGMPLASKYRLGQTESYRQFLRRLQSPVEEEANAVKKEMEKRVMALGDAEGFSPVGRLHGDASPIHFFYEKQPANPEVCVLYGIDFNGSSNGPLEEDIGLFLGNSYFAYANALLDGGHIIDSLREALQETRTPSGLLEFYIAKSYYDKARAEKGGLRQRLLEASLNNLTHDFELHNLKV